MKNNMKFGVAKDIITPCIRTTLMGFGSVFGKPFKDIHDDLYVRTLLLEDAQSRQIILIALDLAFHDDSLTEELRKYVADQYNVPHDNLSVTYTHTHFGPSVKGYDLIFHDPAYEKFLFERITQCIDRAYLNCYEGIMEYGSVEGGWNISRRRMVDGVMKFIPNPDGEIDKSIHLLKLSDHQGNLKVLLTNFSCHPSNINQFLTISSEYPGRLCNLLEKEYYGCTALFFQGCGADSKLRPGAVGDRFIPISYDTMNEVAIGMAERIKGLLLSKNLTPIHVSLDARMFKIPVPLEVYPKSFYEQISAEYSGQPGVHFEKELMSNEKCVDVLRWASTDYVLDHYENMEDTIDLNCGVIRISDDFYIVTMGGEPSYNVKQVLEQVFPNKQVMFFGYADAIAYVPSDKIIAEGGYEADGSVTEYRLKGRIAPGIDELYLKYFKDAVHDLGCY